MRTDGFHYTSSPQQAGYGVNPETIERGRVVSSDARSLAWKYQDTIPLDGRRDLYFFSYDDLEHLMQKSREDVKLMMHAYRWRSRIHNTTKIREFYLADLLVTCWTYMTNWYGARFDEELLYEARRRL